MCWRPPRRARRALPDVPTFSESGYPGFEASSWVGFFVPRGTPSAIVGKLNREINAIIQEDETKKRLDALSLEIFIRDQIATAVFFSQEVANWSRMVEAVGIPQ